MMHWKRGDEKDRRTKLVCGYGSTGDLILRPALLNINEMETKQL
jgi:hypothetical protein